MHEAANARRNAGHEAGAFPDDSFASGMAPIGGDWEMALMSIKEYGVGF